MLKTENLEASLGYTACKDAAILNDRALLAELMRKMLTVRFFEERITELFGEGRLHGTVHTCVGEEAACVGTTAALKREDYMVSTHRGHGHAIGKGMDVNAMMAEIFGKETGVNRGRGGSMHMADPEIGAIGSNGIVGGGVPVACGAALTIKLKKIPDRVSLVFFGDGAANEGSVHESMNLASAWSLPVIFVLQNNCYGLSMPFEKAVGESDFTKRAAAYGIKSFECDGNDVLSVYETVLKARKYCLEEGRPAFVLENTYRISGHSKSDDNFYRDPAEMAAWRDRDPIDRFITFLERRGTFTAEEMETIRENAVIVVATAENMAEAAADPSVADVKDGLWAKEAEV